MNTKAKQALAQWLTRAAADPKLAQAQVAQAEQLPALAVWVAVSIMRVPVAIMRGLLGRAALQVTPVPAARIRAVPVVGLWLVAA